MDSIPRVTVGQRTTRFRHSLSAGTYCRSSNASRSRSPYGRAVGFMNPNAFDVAEVVHDPELDEAVIAFANADFDLCERCLLDLVNPGGPGMIKQKPGWFCLISTAHSTCLSHFENLAVSFVHKFGLSAPQWYSLPQRVADHLAAKSRPKPKPCRARTASGHPLRSRPKKTKANRQNAGGWIAPVYSTPRPYRSCALKSCRCPALDHGLERCRSRQP